MAERLVRMMITLPPEMAERLGAYAASDEAKRSGITDRVTVIRLAVADYLTKRGA